ncbi:hypothetical protein B9T64_06745 [Bacillus halotolerans]|uniref:hypothetical protein n=1 Tax=Bacillus halotolerans TaxID=260554 RepID=UPI000BFEC938|nr:hypothetical protein [Bacillus halotolerans]PHI49675.1 hypothetical protein B9T64_06745 [Bacillus halotolerans]
MSLLMGIVLPKGVLIVSDTRTVGASSLEILSDMSKKITYITKNVVLGGAGSETNWYTAQILRDSLYNQSEKFTREQTLAQILGLYCSVNKIRKSIDPVGSILVAEYDEADNVFRLHCNDGLNNYTSFETLNEVKDIAIIGSNNKVRNHVKQLLKNEIDKCDPLILQQEKFYELLSLYCKKLYKVLRDETIGENLYCVYITSIDNKAASATYFIGKDDVLKNVDSTDDQREIKI